MEQTNQTTTTETNTNMRITDFKSGDIFRPDFAQEDSKLVALDVHDVGIIQVSDDSDRWVCISMNPKLDNQWTIVDNDVDEFKLVNSKDRMLEMLNKHKAIKVGEVKFEFIAAKA